MARFASNDRINLKVGVSSHSEQLTSLEVVGRVGINSTISENALDVVGNANVDGNISVSGLSTFTGIVTTGGDLYVGGDLFVKDDLVYDEVTGRNINISGVATIGQTLDVNGNLDVDGHTELDNVNVSGFSTFASNLEVTAQKIIINNANSELRFEDGSGGFSGSLKRFGTSFVAGSVDDLKLRSGLNDEVKISDGSFDYPRAIFKRNEVELYYNNSKKFETTGAGVTVFGTTQTLQLNVTGVSTFQSHIHLGDDDELRFGASNDFKIFHDPDDARIENSNGDIKFKNTGSYFFFDEDGGETLASFINDGAVNLYYNGSKKFETTPTGVNITDDLNVAGVSTFAGNINANGNIVGDNSTNISGINSVTAVTYFGDGSQLTGSGGGTLIQGISIEEEGSNVGTAGSIKIINFKGPGVTAASVNALKVDVTVDTGINTAGGSSFNDLNVTGVSTFAGNINANGNIIGDSATNISGINSVTATNYFGNGVNLSGIVTSLVAGANISISGATGQVTITGLANTANVTANTLVVSGFSTLASASFSGDVSIGGTLTYEDVTNIDSVGLITARAGIRIGTGGTVGPSGPGIVTYFGDGSQLSGVQGGKWEETDVGINTSSNVGIGTTNPVHKLEVLGDTNLTGNLNVVGITTINGNSVPSIGMVIALSGF
jgi:hypothetical protein